MLALISICLDLSFPSVVQKVVTWDSLSARQPSISIPALFKTYSDSLHNPSTQVSLNSFQEPPRYGNKKSRAQGLSLSLIALSLSFFICNIGIIISTMPNSPDCVRVEQMRHQKALCKPPVQSCCANVVIFMVVLWFSQPYFMTPFTLLFSWTTACWDHSHLWAGAQASPPESRFGGQAARGLDDNSTCSRGSSKD